MTKNKRQPRQPKAWMVIMTLFLCSVLGFTVATLLLLFWPITSDKGYHQNTALYYTHEDVIINDSAPAALFHKDCVYHSCFDAYRCHYTRSGQISVYVYRSARYLDSRHVPITLNPSLQFVEIIEAIKANSFYTDNADEACLLVPFIDFLNQDHIRLQETSKVLRSLHRWGDGSNHLLFNMLPGTAPDYNTSLDVPCGKAIIAGAGFDTTSYRHGYDVSIPLINPHTMYIDFPSYSIESPRPYILMSGQFHYHPLDLDILKKLSYTHKDFLLFTTCLGNRSSDRSHICHNNGQVYQYPQILQMASFCLVIRGVRLAQTALYDALKTGCIPVVVADGYIMPFNEVLDWQRASVRVAEENLPKVMEILLKYKPQHIVTMRKQVHFLFNTYLHNMAVVTVTTLQIINDRVVPHLGRGYSDWNEPPDSGRVVSPPLFLPLKPPQSQGFTAVILSYDRLDSLFTIIKQVALVPSLIKILVIWNNQVKTPPEAAQWPRINKPLKVIQTAQNHLSNRFYPYDEIETEAVFSLDDDIVTLTIDEIEFGYQAWREFPDRLVGFPSRLHLWNNVTNSWKYESEWTWAISMVLTGAAFYHKYYSFLYTNNLPGNLKVWVDEHMNCEDIAMNFLIANVTGLAPIKVTPHQKFKCMECNSQEALSADLKHLVARSECVKTMADIYGMMPLKTVEFRVDPVLFKDDLPPELLQYKDVGAL